MPDSAPDEYRSIVDPARIAFLGLIEGTDAMAVIAVRPDGSEQAWIYIDGAPSEMNFTVPAHEHVGPLPPMATDRINDVILRCGRPTKSGRPCRQRVNVPGNSCPIHAPHKEAPAALQRDRSE